MNTVTHYLDLSLVYGPSDAVAASLRAGFGGRLNIELKNNREFPPSVSNKSATCDTIYEFEACYATGENNLQICVRKSRAISLMKYLLLRDTFFYSECNERFARFLEKSQIKLR